MLNPWLAFPFQAARLGWEAQNVMALRLMRLAGGGAAGQPQAHLTGTEKVAAKVAAPAKAHAAGTAVAVKSRNGRDVAKKVTRGHKKRVRGNKRRLSK
jgi:hypothetical protein